MKSLLAISLIIVFIGFSAFGFAVVNHKMNMDHQGNSCIASAIDGTLCPSSLINLSLHRTLIVQLFSKALSASSLELSLFLLLILFLLGVVFSRLRNYFYRHWRLGPPRWQKSTANYHLFKPKFVRWLALLEESPVS